MSEPSLEYLFHPRSVAVVGASAASESWVNHSFVRPLLDGVYQGKLYLVNPNVSEILGQKAYPSLREVPNPLDYVICAVPARLTPQLLEECGDKGVKAVHLY
ncbi:MAG: CoA-binding protein, partial [Chloroflexota bacterium]|nr:CoA-binding protein [Chloroflexota bacterium]